MSDDFFAGLDNAVETLRLGTTAERLATLVKLSSELVTALDARQALLTVGEAVRDLTGGERFLAMDKEGLVIAARDHEGVDLVLPPQHCAEIAREAMRSGEVQFVYLPRGSAKWRETQSALRYTGLLAVPLMSAQGSRGAVYVDSQATFAEALEPALVEVLLLLGSHAAAVIDNAEVLERVNKDPASELQTTAYFERRLGEELKRSARYARPFSVAFVEMLDADACFKRYGPAALDALMRELGVVLRGECRASDVLARVGPARLGVLCPELHLGEDGKRMIPKELVQRWRKRIDASTFRVGNVPQRMQVRVGAVTYQEPPVLGLKGVLHEADLAIEVAKREGDDHFVVR